MATHDYNLANASGSSFRSDLNDAMSAIVSINSSASAPATTFAYMLWADTTNGLLKQRNAANSGWIIRNTLAETRVVAKSSTYTVVDDDFGKLFKCSGTWDLVLTAAATLADGFFFSVRNTGVGTITINPDASEQIDGATTLALAAGEGCDVWCDGSGFFTIGKPATAASNVFVPVRQTVLSGPVDSNGLAAFGGSTGGTSVTMTGTLYATAANGFGASGAVDYVGAGTNLSWTGLSTNGTMYLYVDISGGVLSTGSGTLAPVYQWGNNYDTGSGQFTFCIQEMVGKVGNGASAVQTNRVYVGEVTVAGGVVTAITWYALMGRYQSALTSVPSTSARTAFTHNVGVAPQYLRVESFVRFLTTWNSYTSGMVVKAFTYHNGTGVPPVEPMILESATVAAYNSGSYAAVAVGTPANGGTSYTVVPSGAGTGQIYVTVERGW